MNISKPLVNNLFSNPKVGWDILKQHELRQRVSQEFYCINNIMISEGIMDKMDKKNCNANNLVSNPKTGWDILKQ